MISIVSNLLLAKDKLMSEVDLKQTGLYSTYISHK